jgi:hypothetical protein
MHACVAWQPSPVAPLKRSHPLSREVTPQPLPTRALPTALWEDHLLPLLTCKEAARLGCTCKALMGVVRGHFQDLGRIRVSQLPMALTTFPGARKAELIEPPRAWDSARARALERWFCEQGGARALTTVRPFGPTARKMVGDALKAGALPSLVKGVDLLLDCPRERDILTQGHLAAMHQLRVYVELIILDEMESQLSALGLVRRLPALTELKLHISPPPHYTDRRLVQWLSFIPPSLKTL